MTTETPSMLWQREPPTAPEVEAHTARLLTLDGPSKAGDGWAFRPADAGPDRTLDLVVDARGQVLVSRGEVRLDVLPAGLYCPRSPRTGNLLPWLPARRTPPDPLAWRGQPPGVGEVRAQETRLRALYPGMRPMTPIALWACKRAAFLDEETALIRTTVVTGEDAPEGRVAWAYEKPFTCSAFKLGPMPEGVYRAMDPRELSPMAWPEVA